MDLAIIVLLLTCVANVFLGLFVLLRNSSDSSSRSFFAMSTLISSWAFTNFMTENATSLNQNVLFNKMAYFFGFLAITASAVFSYYFTRQKQKHVQEVGFMTIVPLVSLLSLTSLIAGKVTKDGQGLHFSTGSLILVYDLAALWLVTIIIKNFYSLSKNGTALQRSQARIISFTFAISIIIGMTTNAILPAIFDNFTTAKYGPPLLSLFLTSLITYAIIRHRLFDIRPIVARSVAYVLTLGSIAVVYSFVAFGIANRLFESNANSGQRIFYIVTTILAAFSFQPLRHQFDKITNRIFYRDAYDPQELIDRLNNELVRHIDLEELLKKAAKIITSQVKAEHCLFIIKETGSLPWQAFGLTDKVLEDVLTAIKHIPRDSGPRILITNELADKHPRLGAELHQNHVAIVVKLKAHTGLVGYLLLGEKMSGNPYSQQDLRMLDILADELAIAIQNSLRFEEIKGFNLTLQEKVDEATAQLRQANRRLKELDNTKDEFISMASHQLRTPLTTIKGYLSMILEGDVGSVTKKERDMIQHAFDGAERMVFLIGDLLNVSRLQSGKFVIDNKPTDLAKMINSEIVQLQETAKNHHLTLTFKKPEKFPLLNLDDTKIRQVIMNFIDNAIYYTPAGGSIEAKLEATDNEIRFTVTDTGLGVPKEAQHRLFSKFYRAGNARKMRPDGTGLGLFMAKKVITAQEGAITFNSVEGKGSIFGFSFPRSKVELKTATSEKPKEKAPPAA